MFDLRFEEILLPSDAPQLRREVRAFLDEEIAAGNWTPNSNFSAGFSPAFSRKLGARGWIGMTWPKAFGGHERSMLHRYIVTEELLAAGAPVAAHWVADRQSGPLILRVGSERQCREILPRIARGECFFCIGMSEPDSGSDLASIRTRAVPTDGGWRIRGRKLWTSFAHHCHYALVLCRTAPDGADRHAGFSQFIVDLSLPGIDIRPVVNLAGEHDFNEVIFDDVWIPDGMLLGKVGEGWSQVMGELAYERSGPERFLSTVYLLRELVREVGGELERRQAEEIGRFVAHLWTLRQMSLSVAGMLERGDVPELQPALVKELGNRFEQEIPEVSRRLVSPLSAKRRDEGANSFAAALEASILHAPSFSLRGGTREILRGIIARGLGLR